MTIGATIKRLRQARGMTQEQLADAINARRSAESERWNQSNISQIEIGRTKSPPIETLEEIAGGLGLTISGLFLAHEDADIEPPAAPSEPGARLVADIVRHLRRTNPRAAASLRRIEEANDAATYESAMRALAELTAADLAVAEKLGLIPENS